MAIAKDEVSATATLRTADLGPVVFPSLAWFESLVTVMRDNVARYEHLGYTDCVIQFTVTDGDAGNSPIAEDGG